MQGFYSALHRYNVTLEFNQGCGGRSEKQIQAAYDRLIAAFNSLSHDEKKNVSVPAKPDFSVDDTRGGTLFGLGRYPAKN